MISYRGVCTTANKLGTVVDMAGETRYKCGARQLTRRAISSSCTLNEVHPKRRRQTYGTRGQVHHRMSECLVAERDRFMELLSMERQDRVHLEALACSLVQAAYRGYLLRKRLVSINNVR